MAEALLEWRDYKYFPYERDFARLEVERLFGTSPTECDRGLWLPEGAFQEALANRLTYFARVRSPGGDLIVPQQARLEASATQNGPKRQSTRYSAHGLHEYKGKFNPQVVRAIGNILGLNDNAAILDPFCGSGTTLLECAHAGWSAIGLDVNPLAIQIANSKLRALALADGRLAALWEDIKGELEPFAWLAEEVTVRPAEIERALGATWTEELPSSDYVSSWFPTQVCAQVVAIMRAIRSVAPEPEDGAVFAVLMSDQLRNASWQEPSDLRIRRRKEPASNYPLLPDFVASGDSILPRVARARAAMGPLRGSQAALHHDVTSGPPRSGAEKLAWGQLDAIITSPPYAAALPYIDTQRLSLVMLGHIRAEAIRSTEAQLIGAREITTGQRQDAERAIREGDPLLPAEAIDFCRQMLAAAEEPGNGFRRRNKPALVYQYLRLMSQFLHHTQTGLRSGAKAAFVVGVNKTTLGGEEFVIDTPGLLTAVAKHQGFRHLESRPMDTYARFDLHQKNSINVEQLLIFERPG